MADVTKKLEDAYKSTVVSIFPLEIREEKPGLYPGRFIIPASINDEPEVLIVGESTHYVYLDSDRGQMPVRNPSSQVASSIVNDYINSCLCIEEDACPGLFIVPGAQNSNTIKEDFAQELEVAKSRQTNWFKRLVALADDDWSKFHRHNVISKIQRVAAQKLGLEREWAEIAAAVPPINCPYCTSLVPPEAVVCPHCHNVVNKEKYEQLQAGVTKL